MTAYAGINYIREGFNKDPVDGYYVYPAQNDTVWASWSKDSDGDYIYSWNLDSWIYLPEEAVGGESGASRFCDFRPCVKGSAGKSRISSQI